MLLAAAATVSPTLANDEDVLRLIQRVIAGPAEVVEKAYRSFGELASSSFSSLAEHTLFPEVLNRLRWNFSLYVGLDVEAGRHRILTLSFDEPADWRLQQPEIVSMGGGEKRYTPGKLVRRPKHTLYYVLAKVGILPTRFRFQIPSAENAASYHFEATAPLGVRIIQASLLAGRPHEPLGHVSVDHIAGLASTVGLHAVEIPSNSLCRVQLDLRVPSRGWLTQLVTSCAVIFGILVALLVLWVNRLPTMTQDQLTNVVVILVSASAATATLVAQKRFYGLPASMVTYLRAMGVMSLCLPIVAAGYLVYEIRGSRLTVVSEHHIQTAIWALTGAAFLFLLIPALALVLSIRSERLSKAEGSPWDMTIQGDAEDTVFVRQRSSVKADYFEALRQLRFDSPAIGIHSAEGWHEAFRWTNQNQKAAEDGLTRLRAILDLPAIDNCSQFLRCIGCSTIKRCLDLRPSKTGIFR
jgi:hypothetical protein